jgi:hypothetical protein
MTNSFVCASACISSAYKKHLPNHIQMNLSCTYSTDPWRLQAHNHIGFTTDVSWYTHDKCICMCIGMHFICVHETLAKPHTNEFVMHIFYRSVTSTHAQPYRLYQGRVLRPQGVKTTHDQLRRAQGLRPGKAHMVAACGKNQTLPSVAQTFPSYVPTHL